MQLRNRHTFVIVGIILVSLLVIGFVVYYVSASSKDSPKAADSSKIANDFRILSQSRTDVCAYLGNQEANTNYINSLPQNFYLQGSCCTPMDYRHYVSQIAALQNYSSISVIPHDPYNVSSSSAKQMIGYTQINLTASQQAVYNSALKISSEGPCCCQCWAWYAHEGLARALISQYGWNAQQISNIWAFEDCCGGS
jgi:hypothetical protein